MTEKVKAVFGLLGVEPNEVFKIKDYDKEYDIDYLIDGKLKVMYRGSRMDIWRMSLYTIVDFLEEKVKIIKLPKLTEADKNAVRYLRYGGMKYVARDKENWLFGYEKKPVRLETGWSQLNDAKYKSVEVFDNLFQFVQWTDEEPFCIEDLEV